MEEVVLEAGLLLSLENSLENTSAFFHRCNFFFSWRYSLFWEEQLEILYYCDKFHTIYSHIRNKLIWNRDGHRGINRLTSISGI